MSTRLENIHIYHDFSLLPFPRHPTLPTEIKASTQALFLRIIPSLEKELVFLVVQPPALSEPREVFTYIVLFREYTAENAGVAFPLTTRLPHKATALTKPTRRRNNNNFHNGALKQNSLLIFRSLLSRRRF